MTTREAAELFDYGSWAMGRMVGAIEKLEPEQAAAGTVSSFASILATLGHIAGADWIWMRRWHGESPPKPSAKEKEEIFVHAEPVFR